MKIRMLSLLLILLLLLTSACASPEPAGSSESVPEASESEPTPDQTTAPTVPETSPATEPSTATEPATLPDMAVTSTGIMDDAINPEYGAKGTQFAKGNVPSLSLPLSVNYIPEGALTLAVTMVDPDGGDWVHWLAVNIPVNGAACDIQENASIGWPAEIVQGKNDFGLVGYGGPTPPSGVHTYVITVYALSESLDLNEGFNSVSYTHLDVYKRQVR